MLDVETGKQLDDQLKWVRFAGIEWTKDGSGFYYNRYPEPPPGEQYQAAALNQMIYFHKLGTKQDDDQLVYRRPDHPDWNFWRRADRRRQVPGALDRPQHRSAEPGARARASAAADAPFNELIGDFENEFWFIGNEGTQVLFPHRSRCADEADRGDGHRPSRAASM